MVSIWDHAALGHPDFSTRLSLCLRRFHFLALTLSSHDGSWNANPAPLVQTSLDSNPLCSLWNRRGGRWQEEKGQASVSQTPLSSWGQGSVALGARAWQQDRTVPSLLDCVTSSKSGTPLSLGFLLSKVGRKVPASWELDEVTPAERLAPSWISDCSVNVLPIYSNPRDPPTQTKGTAGEKYGWGQRWGKCAFKKHFIVKILSRTWK